MPAPKLAQGEFAIRRRELLAQIGLEPFQGEPFIATWLDELRIIVAGHYRLPLF